MKTHSSILAWKIPWTEQPCGSQSVGSHSDTTKHNTHTKRLIVAVYVSYTTSREHSQILTVLLSLGHLGQTLVSFMCLYCNSNLYLFV